MQNQVNFSTRRRIILIQIMYAISINSSKDIFINPDTRNIVTGAAYASHHFNAEENHIDIEIFMQILEQLSNIDQLITQFLKNSSIDRTAKVVLAILRIGAYEIKHVQQKHKIGSIIKDYLSIATAFDHTFEVGFINGVLDKVAAIDNTLNTISHLEDSGL